MPESNKKSGKTKVPAWLEYDILKDGTAVITGCKGKRTAADLPPQIDGRKVTKVGGYAFYRKQDLISVTIPEGVTSIGKDAFCGCDHLLLPKTLLHQLKEYCIFHQVFLERFGRYHSQ